MKSIEQIWIKVEFGLDPKMIEDEDKDGGANTVDYMNLEQELKLFLDESQEVVGAVLTKSINKHTAIFGNLEAVSKATEEILGWEYFRTAELIQIAFEGVSDESERFVIREDETTLLLENILSEEKYDNFFDDTTQFFAVWTMQFEQQVEVDQESEEVWSTPESKLIDVDLEHGYNEQLGIWYL